MKPVKRSPHHRREAGLPIDDRGGLQRQPQGLVDILDKILDKGLVVAGDVKVSLANVELLTIQLRLVICSIDKAEAIGINWWRSDRFYSSDARALPAPEEYDELRNRIAELERQLSARELPDGKPGERKGR
ncbi:MAG: gas vesicle protein [Thermoanaerobaculia bacterium]